MCKRLATVILAGIVAFDKAIRAFLIQRQRPGLTRVMQNITCLGSSVVSFPVYTLCFVFGQDIISKIAAKAIIAESFVLAFIVILRYYTRRERPVAQAASLWNPWNRYSFPSHHSSRIWMVAILVIYHYKHSLITMVLIAITVSFSRIYLQKHYFTDVLCGSIIGSCAALFLN